MGTYQYLPIPICVFKGENGPALEEILKKELEVRPGDVTLRIRLASLYQRVGRIEDGWGMVTEVEAGQPWPQSKDWYSALVEMAENYQVQFKPKCGAAFYQVYISGLDRLVGLHMRENSATSVIADTVHRMDQAVHELSQCNNPSASCSLQHLRGQLALNCAALIAKRALKEPSSWRDGSKLSGILYLLAWTLEGSKEEEGRSKSRKTVAGHMLRTLQGDDVEWAERLVGQAGPGLGERLHKAVFCARDQRAASSTSWLAQQSSVPSFSVPSLAEIAGESKGYLEEHKTNLHFIIWLLGRYGLLFYLFVYLCTLQALQTWQGSGAGIPTSMVGGLNQGDSELCGHGKLPLRDPLLGRMGLRG